MRPQRRRLVRPAMVGVAAAVVVVAVALPLPAPADGRPPESGYFETLPAGSWQSLPDDATCAGRVRPSTWEPRPENTAANRRMPDREAVRLSLSSRPRASQQTYDQRWDTWLLARVSGRHTGTTDENIQWAACKWGLSDNLLRAVAITESSWYQYLTDAAGRCVDKRGCGDEFDRATEASGVYCRGIGQFGYDYQRDYGPGKCPKTFSIIGVMSWQDPAWTDMSGNQNGTFPFNRDSTAFALDYYGAFIRGCMEGWMWWLTGSPPSTQPRDLLWGCVGTWYAGAWMTAGAQDYVKRVRKTLDSHSWLTLAPGMHVPQRGSRPKPTASR
ncbi:hypothetical protein ACFV9C_28745 [Kribbella sp. NPDC059898]|uniref:hypothetical protein n=1 Tax=Kribbella sp. NPDC059898 TaxID=3346995 RepID=UPI00364A172E